MQPTNKEYLNIKQEFNRTDYGCKHDDIRGVNLDKLFKYVLKNYLSPIVVYYEIGKLAPGSELMFISISFLP